MKTLIIYDNTGRIYSMVTGDYEKPQGLVNSIEYEVPANMIVVSVNVETGEPVLLKKELSPIEVMQQQLKDTQEAINFLLMGGL